MRRPNLNWEAYQDLRRTLDLLTIQGPVEVLRYIASQKYGASVDDICAHCRYPNGHVGKWIIMLADQGLVHLRVCTTFISGFPKPHDRWFASWSTISRINKAISKMP